MIPLVSKIKQSDLSPPSPFGATVVMFVFLNMQVQRPNS